MVCSRGRTTSMLLLLLLFKWLHCLWHGLWHVGWPVSCHGSAKPCKPLDLPVACSIKWVVFLMQNMCSCCLLYAAGLLASQSSGLQHNTACFVLLAMVCSLPCRQLFLQTPFRHEIHSDVQGRIQEAFETGCEFREVAACYSQQGDIFTFQLLFLPVSTWQTCYLLPPVTCNTCLCCQT